MKKLFLSAVLFGAFFTVQAQTNLTGTAATSRAVLSMSAQEMSRQMYNELELNEGQYIKLKALNQARFDKFSEIEKMYGNDAQMREAKIKEVNEQLDQEFAQVLTPKQFTAYLEMDGRAMAASATTETGASSTNVSAGSTTTTPTTGTVGTSTNTTKEGTTSAELKVKDDKVKMESGSDKVKLEDNKMKAESASGEMKVKGDSEKLKTESVKYKSSPSETKIITPQGKSKVEHDKVKIKTETTKKKVKN